MDNRPKHTYPVLFVNPLHGDINERLTRQNKCSAALYHRNVVAVVIIISSDIVARIAAANDNRLLAFGIFGGFSELR